MATDETDLREALKKAIRDGNESELIDAIRAGAEVGPNAYDETALMDAALAGHLPIVKLLVEEMGQDVNATSKGGATPLIRAAVWGNDEVVRYLVKKGADLNAMEHGGSFGGYSSAVMAGGETHVGTALIAAVSVGPLDIVRFLVERGADVTLRNSRGHTAFENAIRHNRCDIVDYFLERLKMTREAGFLVAARLNLKQTKRFVETLGVSAAATDKAGFTGLMAAAKEGDYVFLEEGPHPGPMPDHVIMATYLLEQGCPINAQNRDGQTALMFAAGSEFSGLVHLLVESGADPDLTDRWSKAAYHYVKLPPEPPESWENAHEAWGYESLAIQELQDYLASVMKTEKPEV